MKGRRQQQNQDLTGRYLRGELEEEPLEMQERFSGRTVTAQQRKMRQTALLRAAEEAAGLPEEQVESLPLGQVVQVYSLFCDVEFEGVVRLCVVRKTMAQLAETGLVVGDWVRFRELGTKDEQGRPEAVIERVLPRKTVLTRADSFKAIEQQPIVANAEQMLIVASVREPNVKWGLVDRMIVAAQSGGLTPIVCVNKMDLAKPADQKEERAILHYYGKLGIQTIETSVPQRKGLETVAAALRGRVTVLAGHSGVGKSSLIQAIQPTLNLRIGAISGYTGKGRHTTSSARRYLLEMGGYVIDTPGVKMFGLWGVTGENLLAYFPDVQRGDAPQWREESYERVLESLDEK